MEARVPRNQPAFPDLYMGAYREVLAEQDEYLKGIEPGKETLHTQLSDEQVLRNYDRLIAGQPEHLLVFAKVGCERTGVEPTPDNVMKYARNFAREMQALRDKGVNGGANGTVA
jgi:hypothetical protein